MRIVIEFYRTRAEDEAHAVVGREAADVADREAAIDAARELARTLDMPQHPDAVTITDADGVVLYSGAIDGQQTGQEQ